MARSNLPAFDPESDNDDSGSGHSSPPILGAASSPSSSQLSQPPRVPTGLGLGFPGGVFDTSHTWPDVDQIILKGFKVARLTSLFGRHSFVIFKPNFVEHRGFCDDSAGFSLFLGEVGGYQMMCSLSGEIDRTALKAELMVQLQSPQFHAGAVEPSSNPAILVRKAVTFSIVAVVEILDKVEVDRVWLARHGQKVPMRVAHPLLLSIRNDFVSMSIDIAYAWNAGGGVPLFHSERAARHNMWMMAELGIVPEGSRDLKFGSVLYAVPAHYGAPGSKLTVYPGGYMHHAKLFLGNPTTLALPTTIYTLRNRIDNLRTAAAEMLSIFTAVPRRLGTARLEVSIADTRDITSAIFLAEQIATGEQLRLDAHTVSVEAVTAMLRNISQLAPIFGENARAPTFAEVATYIRKIHSLGFYTFNWKAMLDPTWKLIPDVVPIGELPPVPPLRILSLPYLDVLLLYCFIGTLPRNRARFTYRILETKTVASADGLGTIKRTYPVTNGSFSEPHMAAEALAIAFQASGKPLSDFAIEVDPCMFGPDTGLPFPTQGFLEELRVRRPDVPVYFGPGIAPAADMAVGLIASSNLSVQMGLLSVTNPLFVEPSIPIGSPVVSALHSVSDAALQRSPAGLPHAARVRLGLQQWQESRSAAALAPIPLAPHQLVQTQDSRLIRRAKAAAKKGEVFVDDRPVSNIIELSPE